MLLSFIAFIAVTGTLWGAYALSMRWWFREDYWARDRMRRELGVKPEKVSANPLFKNPDRLNTPFPLGSEAASHGAKGRWRSLRDISRSLRGRLELLLERSNAPLSLLQLLVLSVGLGAVFGAAGTRLGGWVVGVLAGTTSLCLPTFILHRRERSRREKCLQQLPVAFEAMARMIRSGQSIAQALQMVAETFEEPIAGEFAISQHQQNLGVRPEVSYQDMADRLDIVELQIFVMAILVQKQCGGNVAEMFERLGGLIRARLRLREQVKTLTAEGRLQGLTLTILPFLIFGVMMFINRGYAESLLEHRTLLYGTLACMGAGTLWIRKIVALNV